MADTAGGGLASDVVLPLVCLDVDGTLVGSSGAPTDELWAAAARARARGQRLTLCTARLAGGATRVWAEQLDPDSWHVFHTGAALWHPASGAVRTTPLTDDAVAASQDRAAEHDWVFEAYSWDDFTVDSDAPLAVAHAGLLGMVHRRRPIDALEAPVVRAQFVVPIGEVDLAVQSAPPGCIATAATSPSMPGAAFVSVTVDSVSKASGIALIADELGVDMADVMMVGDGHNDLPAIEAVGWGVAIGDGVPEVVAAARLVVAGVDQGGAVEAIDTSAHLSG